MRGDEYTYSRKEGCWSDSSEVDERRMEDEDREEIEIEEENDERRRDERGHRTRKK